MAMAVTYNNFSDEVVGEDRGGVISFYGADTLGSTSVITGTSGAVTDHYYYWPYGETRQHVGSSVTPFTFVGALGYYFDRVPQFFYIRARIMLATLARWLSLDPIWPRELGYEYAYDMPTTLADPAGMQPIIGPIIGVIAACGMSLGKSLWNLIFGGGTLPPGSLCQAGASCLGALLAAVASIAFAEAGPLATCLGAAIGSLVGTLLSEACSGGNTPLICALRNVLVNAATACLSGAFGGLENKGLTKTDVNIQSAIGEGLGQIPGLADLLTPCGTPNPPTAPSPLIGPSPNPGPWNC